MSIPIGSADGTVKLYQLSGKKLLQTFIHSRRDSSSSSNRTGDDNHHDVSVDESYAHTQDDDGEPVFVMDEGSMLGVECVGFPSEEFKWVASGGTPTVHYRTYCAIMVVCATAAADLCVDA